MQQNKERRKKITFFIPSLDTGGAEKVFLTIANQMAINEYDVTFLLVRKQGKYLGLLNSNIKVIAANNPNIFSAFFCILHFIINQRPQAVYSTIWYCNFLNILATRLTGGKNSCIVRESVYPRNYLQTRSIWSRWIYKIYWSSYYWADRIICPSRAIAEYFRLNYSIAEDKIYVISNPVDIESIKIKSAERPAHPWFNDANIKTIVSVGRLDSAKGYDDLIKACKLLQSESWRLMILGEGGERQYLEKIITDLNLNEQIALPGNEENPYSYMKYATVFVLSSRYEGMPNVLIEALACGSRIISTNCDSGPAEVLENGLYGKLTEVGDIKALASTIENELGQSDNCGVADLSKYDVSLITEKYLDLLERI